MMLGNGKLIKLANGKKLGVVRKDRTFMTFRKEKTHLLKVYNAWALNQTLLNELRDVGVEWVEVHCSDTDYVYRTRLENFFEAGIVYQNPKNEKDIQIALPLRFWLKFPALSKRKIKRLEKSLKEWLGERRGKMADKN